MSDHPLDGLLPHLPAEHRPTIEVLVHVLRTGRLLEAWLSDTLAVNELDTSEFSTLATLWLGGAPHRLSAGEISASVVQTTGGTTKTIQRLEARGLVTRVTDPGDGRRTLIELTATGLEAASSALDLVLDTFDLDIGDLDAAARSELGIRLATLSAELDERLRSR